MGLLSQTNYHGKTALSYHWDPASGEYLTHGSSEHAQLVTALLNARVSTTQVERAFHALAIGSELHSSASPVKDMLTLLLNSRADVNYGDNIDATALHYSAMVSQNDHMV